MIDGIESAAVLSSDGNVIVDGKSISQDAVTFLPPVRPSKIVCVGFNYRDHVEEAGAVLPDAPVIFLKPPSSLSVSGAPIIRQPEVTRIDYEGELGVVIGRRATRVSAEEALDYVAGLVVANDVSARNFQRLDNQWTQAKSYDTFAPIAVGVVETTDWSGRAITTSVNGKTVQSSNTDQFIFSVPELIEFISAIMTLEPEDIILTGTPAGIGPMETGDVVEVAIEGLGVVTNTVVAPS